MKSAYHGMFAPIFRRTRNRLDKIRMITAKGRVVIMPVVIIPTLNSILTVIVIIQSGIGRDTRNGNVILCVEICPYSAEHANDSPNVGPNIEEPSTTSDVNSENNEPNHSNAEQHIVNFFFKYVNIHLEMNSWYNFWAKQVAVYLLKNKFPVLSTKKFGFIYFKLRFSKHVTLSICKKQMRSQNISQQTIALHPTCSAQILNTDY